MFCFFQADEINVGIAGHVFPFLFGFYVPFLFFFLLPFGFFPFYTTPFLRILYTFPIRTFTSFPSIGFYYMYSILFFYFYSFYSIGLYSSAQGSRSNFGLFPNFEFSFFLFQANVSNAERSVSERFDETRKLEALSCPTFIR